MPHSPSGNRLRHVALPVADLERAIDFYTRSLGMKVIVRRQYPTRGESVAHVSFDEAQPTLELVGPLNPDNQTDVSSGRIHIALDIHDLAGLCERLTRDGVDVVEPLSRGGSDGKRIFAWIRDRDGHLLELVEASA